MYVLVYNCITIYSLMQNYLWKFTVKCTFLVPMALFLNGIANYMKQKFS